MGHESREGRETSKLMPCDSTDSTIVELQAQGWEDAYSFHVREPEQWNMACDRAYELLGEGWDVVLVGGQDEAEKQDGVTYLYKKKETAE